MDYNDYTLLMTALDNLRHALRVNNEALDDDLKETWEYVQYETDRLLNLIKNYKIPFYQKSIFEYTIDDLRNDFIDEGIKVTDDNLLDCADYLKFNLEDGHDLKLDIVEKIKEWEAKR